ncbi:DUF1932 domain-containing protein [Amycolatopsis sp. FBCC-B4732]|uniref:DUF1932 domain-containing protein n=1 Tax=Amycolatopsis sp. FBCC-B4732 TaxID=3079339 RepID=UPI001FF2F0DC|nr:DUF1932 domain-containing protein [Amycolatopsis sp. FBCC-B4732]UOX92591.1 DUF1932 domain-containing protein [Amycolatopsis sp. FBCC-B4732]
MPGTIAVLGLGEAGGHLARDLAAAGAVVRAYDPAVTAASAGIATSGSSDTAAPELGATAAVPGAFADTTGAVTDPAAVTASRTGAAALASAPGAAANGAEASTAPASTTSKPGATTDPAGTTAGGAGATTAPPDITTSRPGATTDTTGATASGAGASAAPAGITTSRLGATASEAGASAAIAGVILTGSEAEAADEADLVLSVNSASAALDALRAGLAGLRPGAVWADLNTASPGTKRRLADLAAEHGVAFADVAIMAPVPGRGLSVPMLTSGKAAEAVAATLNGFGAAVDVLPGEAGVAAERKLLRSVFFKGMSAAVVEALQAARAAGCEDWLRDVIVGELTAAGAGTVDRLVTGSYRHAVRRTAEMAAAAEMLGELDVRADVAAAARDQLRFIAGSQDC